MIRANGRLPPDMPNDTARQGMSHKKRRRKLAGHYCWACDRRRANEKFSGRGHARHVCRDCAKLGAEELAYRQALRNLERCMTWEGLIPRKRRRSFERFLNHDDPRIRACAEEMLKQDAAERALRRSAAEWDEATLEDCLMTRESPADTPAGRRLARRAARATGLVLPTPGA